MSNKDEGWQAGQQSTVAPCWAPPEGAPSGQLSAAGCLLDGCVHQLFIQGAYMLLGMLLGLMGWKSPLAGAVLRPQPSFAGKGDNEWQG